MKKYSKLGRGTSNDELIPRVMAKTGKGPATGILGGMILSLWVSAFLSSALAWDLPQCIGTQKDGWSAIDNNWSWDHGNPYKVDGGQWTVAGQDKVDPATTDAYVPLTQATLYHFINGWTSEGTGTYDDALFKYFGESKDGRKLCVRTKADGGFPQNGPAAAILFKVSKEGQYQVAIEGKISVQNKTAGYARVQIFVLSGDRTVEVPLKSFDLNNEGGTGGNGTPSDQLTYSDTVTMKAGDELVTRMQTISPGAATGGSSALVISKYNISPIDKK